MGHCTALFGRTQKEDVAAMEVATQLMPGELRDMSCLPAPGDGGRPLSVLERHPAVVEYMTSHDFRVLAARGAAAAGPAPPVPGPAPPAEGASAAAPVPPVAPAKEAAVAQPAAPAKVALAELVPCAACGR